MFHTKKWNFIAIQGRKESRWNYSFDDFTTVLWGFRKRSPDAEGTCQGMKLWETLLWLFWWCFHSWVFYIMLPELNFHTTDKVNFILSWACRRILLGCQYCPAILSKHKYKTNCTQRHPISYTFLFKMSLKTARKKLQNLTKSLSLEQ